MAIFFCFSISYVMADREVINALNQGLKVEAVDPDKGLDQSDKVNYFITRLKRGENQENANKFFDFRKSSTAQEIYKQYGFVPFLAP